MSANINHPTSTDQMPINPHSGAVAQSRTEYAVTITMKASEMEVTPVVDNVMEVVREAGCAIGKELDVELSLREALANAIKHGANNDERKLVECRVTCGTSGLLVVVRDPGNGFDPKSVPNPLSEENLYSNHGRGLFLITKLMDEVTFERNGTEIHMRKY